MCGIISRMPIPISPLKIDDHSWINEIELNDNNKFQKKIVLNPGLNAIIGGKSSGKSILLYELAKGASDDNVSELEKNHTLWQDPFTDDKTLPNPKIKINDTTIDSNISPIKVTYIPQLYINKISEDVNNSYLQELIKKNISYNEDSKMILDNIQSNISNSKEKVESLIEELQKNNSNENEIKKELASLGSLDAMNKEKKNQEEIYNKITAQSQISKQELQLFEDKRRQEEIKNKELIEYNRQLVDNNEDKEKIIGIKKNIETNFGIQLNGEKYGEELKRISEEFKNKLNLLLEMIDKDKTKNSDDIKRVSDELETIKDEIAPIIEKQDKLNGLKQIGDKISSIKGSIKKFEDFDLDLKVKKDNEKEIINNIKIEYLQLINELNEDASKLSKVVVTSNLKIHASVQFEQEKYEKKVFELIDGRKKSKAEDMGIPAEFVFNNGIDYPDKWSELIRKSIDGELDDMLGKKNDAEDMISALGDSMISVSVDIEKEGDLLKKMSPGKRAIVVLELLLNIKNDDNSPILLDQPEDNLDNRTISNELVKLIRDISLERQIIMVTHNANLVVLSDADEVIIANQDPNLNENVESCFEYYTGSLENTVGISRDTNKICSKGIKENVTDILEGGMVAFRTREQKYMLD